MLSVAYYYYYYYYCCSQSVRAIRVKIVSLCVLFSCVITELFTEGRSPFDLSQLLGFRSGDYTPTKLVQSIDDDNIRVSLAHLQVFLSV